MQENIHSQQNYDEDEINLLDVLVILAKHKYLIIIGILAPGVIMAICTLFMTPVYQADTKIYIPQLSPSISSQFLNQLGPMVSMAGAAKPSPNNLYVEIFKSRPLCDRMIDRFELLKADKNVSREALRKALLGSIKARQDLKSGIIIFGIQDENPKRSAELANAFVEEFRKLNMDNALTEASKRRLFFEEQLKHAKETLTDSEEALKKFQEKTGAVKIDTQASATIESIARLRAQIASNEVALKVMNTYSTYQNPNIRRIETEIIGLREQVRRIETQQSDDSIMVSTSSFPSTKTEYQRLIREMKFNETLYGLLINQYQSAKLEEASDAMTLQVIEKAEVPLIRIKPKRKKLVLTSMIMGFFGSLAAVFLIQYVRKISQDPDNKERMELLKKHMAFKK